MKEIFTILLLLLLSTVLASCSFKKNNSKQNHLLHIQPCHQALHTQSGQAGGGGGVKF